MSHSCCRCDAMMHYFNWKKKLAHRHSFLHRHHHHTWHSTHSSPIQRWAHRCCCLRWWVITIELIDNRGWSRFSIFNSFSQTASHSTSVISQNTAWLLFAVFFLSFYQHSFSKWPAKEVCRAAAALKGKIDSSGLKRKGSCISERRKNNKKVKRVPVHCACLLEIVCVCVKRVKVLALVKCCCCCCCSWNCLLLKNAWNCSAVSAKSQ